VEFASGSGFARVIDTEKKFSVFFGKVGKCTYAIGLFDVDALHYGLRK
jgi:hypothetical protein